MAAERAGSSGPQRRLGMQRSAGLRWPRGLRWPKGLRWQLAASVALVVVAFSAVTFVVVYRGTGIQLRHQIDREIEGDSQELAQALAGSGAHSPANVADTADRYIRAQPFSPSSTLLFAMVPGARTSTNRPELFGSPAPDNGETVAAQARENALSRHLLSAPIGFSTVPLPDIGDLRLDKQRVWVLGDGRHRAAPVTIGVGEPLASVAHAQRGVARAFILAGALTLIGALLAALWIGTRFSRPLRRMASVAAQVDAGDLHPRIEDVGSESAEIRVLADAFNHMLDRLTDAFAGQRAFVADASHELRTPLTVIRGQLEVLAAQSQPSEPEIRRVERLVQTEVARITRLVDDLLLLAKSEQAQFLRREPIALRPFVRDLWEGIALLGDKRRFELGEIPAGTLLADPDRLAQALRNLASNAIEHTAPAGGIIELEVLRIGTESLRFTVQDNGPGIPEDQRERVFDRFHRTDAARDRASGGTGLGLAIVRAVAEAHGGRARACRGSMGGARIELELPGFKPATSVGGTQSLSAVGGPSTTLGAG